MKNFVTKKNVLIGSLLGSLVFFLGILFLLSNFCSPQFWVGCRGVNDFVGVMIMFSVVFPFLLPFSLLTYKLPEQVFRSWLHFTYAWIPISLLFIFTTPVTSHSWAISVGSGRETITWIMNGLFVVISLVLIIVKSISLRKGV